MHVQLEMRHSAWEQGVLLITNDIEEWMTYDELNFEGDRESHRDGTCRSNRDKAADNQMFME